ncbi:MAG: HNH endonuclease [Phycisphaerae bacterium]|jgi:putative restriction endonuclease
MSLLFLEDPNWDFPFFKKLASNDTSSAPGHQGGMVLPKDLRIFFPSLEGETTETSPTIDRTIKALLTIEGQKIGLVHTRYQIQTWGATRNPESRLTGNLTSLRNQANADDYLVIQRNLEDLNYYRLSLIKTTSPNYKIFAELTSGQRWGTINGKIPLNQRDLDISKADEILLEEAPFQLFEEEVRTTESRNRRIARTIIFHNTIHKIYEFTCAVCSISLRSPNGPIELDAAHVVPKKLRGSDDARNGIALCKRHHWAFDKGLFSIDSDRTIIIPNRVRALAENQVLIPLSEKRVQEATDKKLCVSEEALAWHRENILLSN